MFIQKTSAWHLEIAKEQDQKSIDEILKQPYDLEVLVPNAYLMIIDFDLQANVNLSNWLTKTSLTE